MTPIPMQTTDIEAELRTLADELQDAYQRLIHSEDRGGANLIRRQIESILNQTQKYCSRLRKREKSGAL